MIILESVTPRLAELFKDVRLRALLDTPAAFGSTYAKEAALTDADWITRAAQWSGDNSTTYLALDAGRACGIASATLDQFNPALVHLFSMWVAPTHRRMGIGNSLVEAILAWARTKNARTIQLLVTSNNEAAIKFYQQLGSTFTDFSEPYANDPTLSNYEMVRSTS